MQTELAQDNGLDHSYPRPLLRRKSWYSLNGWWDFVIDPQSRHRISSEVAWTDEKILVPFAPESAKSGIGRTDFFDSCWYRHEFASPSLADGEVLILHFGAVDYEATVWINGAYAGHHVGGYTPFKIDITPFILPDQEMQSIVVRADDDPADLEKPRGKQDWQLKPHSIWYVRTTGIWQTVWLEVVNETRIGHITWVPDLVRWELGFETWLEGKHVEHCQLNLTLTCKGRVLVQDEYAVFSDEVHRRIALSDPGIDDFRNELLWCPETPTLIEAHLELISPLGDVVDEVWSYTALRSIALEGNRFVLNGRVYPMRLVLDQGYWGDTGITPPSEEALRTDIKLVKAMGFNGVRKHQKIEDPRFLYLADTMGLLVWEEMPSAYRFTQIAVDRVINEWKDAVRRDCSHPCIVAWVPVNESWGVPNLPNKEAERSYVQALYYLTKTLDPSRPVVGNDGWESVSTDIIGIHDYDSDPGRIAHRYHADRLMPHTLKRERPGGRILLLGEQVQSDHPIVLSEFGGICLGKKEGSANWGYSFCASPAEFEARYTSLMEVIRSLGMITGFCYTQLTDTYQEANGLLYMDRTPKFPIDKIRRATVGPEPLRIM
jgi:beta-galactosidase/beta-glucuronidase